MAGQPNITTALRAALKETPLRSADHATVELARRYAADIDAGGELGKLGPPLLACLTALGMTPAGRSAILGKGATDQQPATSPIDELRDRRKRRAAAVDTSAG